MSSRVLPLPERRASTHILRFEVPLNLEANPAAESYDIEDAMRQAFDMILAILRVGTLGLLCDDIIVTLEDQDGS